MKKLLREPFSKKEIREILIDNEIRVKGKRVFCAHDKYKAIVFHYPESKKYFIFQLELDL